MGISKRMYVIAAAVAILTVAHNQLFRTYTKHPLTGLNTTELARKYGYPIESHQVITDDGYILTIHRIPHGRNATTPPGTPVLFIHGILHGSAEFINFGPEKSLGLMLADRGYDIWLANARGTTWSRNHTKLDPDKDREFWNFSLHEIGIFDVPKFIDYILEATAQKKIHYIGYSQGVSVFCMMLAEKPQYAEKIKLMTGLAPPIFVKNPQSPSLQFFMYTRRFLMYIGDLLNLHEMMPNKGIIAEYLKQICNEESIFVDMCLHQGFTFHGYNLEQLNKSLLTVMYSNVPAGVSLKQLDHILQIMSKGHLVYFDLGVEDNLKTYGQEEPPSYDLSKTASVPLALYYAKNDWLVNSKNIERVMKALPNIVKCYMIPMEKFNHNDVLYANDVVKVLYQEVIAEIMKF